MRTEGVSIIFDDDGLSIYRQFDGSEKTLLHRVAITTLQNMNLADLEYCLSTNVLMDMPSLRTVFSDYLWADEGEIPPRLDKHAPRSS